MKKNFYITTPIYYVNDVPHLGTAYTTIAADVLARYQRQRGHTVKFLTGTDEHGEKIQEAAEKKGTTPKAFTDEVSAGFKIAWDKLNISYDDFIRTTEARHVETVKECIKKSMAAGDIYLGEYEGWYCVSDEAFYTESQLVNGKSPTGKEVKRIKEENYFFKLSKHIPKLKKYILDHPDFILPETKRNEVLSFLEEDIRDISISRTTFSWGIPFPSADSNGPSKKHVVYVWFDALVNYVSALGTKDFNTFWGTESAPQAIHLIGKDILRFHAVYWPCFLMSIGLPLPKRIFAHGWWTVEGQKMSKSTGNAIDPLAFTAQYGLDAFRLFLFREFPMGQDGDFSIKNFKERVNADLANNLGNLLSRSLNLVNKNLGGKVFTSHDLQCLERFSDPLLEQIKGAYHELFEISEEQYECFEFAKILNKIFSALSLTNKFVEERAPWSLAKDPQKEEALRAVLMTAVESLRLSAKLLWPFIPGTCEEINRRLGQKMEQKSSWGHGVEATIDQGQPLFMRLTI